MNTRTYIAGLVGLLLVSACSTFAPGVDDSKAKRARLELPGSGSDCVFGSVRDFTVLDDRSLLLYTTARNRAYFLEVSGVCIGLDSAFQLGFQSRNDQICGFGSDKIVLGQGSFTETCSIGRLHKLEDGELARVLAHFGRVKVEKAPKPTAETEPDTNQ